MPLAEKLSSFFGQSSSVGHYPQHPKRVYLLNNTTQFSSEFYFKLDSFPSDV